MSLPGLVLVGAGGHARACIDVVESEGRFRIAGLLGAAGEAGTRVLGHEVIGTDEELSALARRHAHALVAVGQILSPDQRVGLYRRLLELGFDRPRIVAASAHVSRHAELGPGTIVMHGAVVNAGARIGENCIINSQALVEHDSVIGDHCHISTGAIVNGGVSVGEGCFVGSGSVLREGIALGRRCVVAMGSVVRHDQPHNSRVQAAAST